MCLGVCTCGGIHTCRSQRRTFRSQLYPSTVDSKSQTQTIRLGVKHLYLIDYLVSHLGSPAFSPRMFAVLEMQPGILNMLGKRPATEPHLQRSIEIQIGILREASPGSEIYRVSR